MDNVDEVEAALRAIFNEPISTFGAHLNPSRNFTTGFTSPEIFPIEENWTYPPMNSTDSVGVTDTMWFSSTSSPNLWIKSEQMEPTPCFPEDSEEIIVHVNHERPAGISPQLPTTLTTNGHQSPWFDDMSAADEVPYNLNEIDLEEVFKGWGDNMSHLLWKITNPINLLDVDGPELIDDTAIGKLRRSLYQSPHLSSAQFLSPPQQVLHLTNDSNQQSGYYDGPKAFHGINTADSLDQFPQGPPCFLACGEPSQGSERSGRSDVESPPKRLKQWEAKCEVCGLLLLGGQQRFEAHMKNAHELKCMCGMSFKFKVKLTHHIRTEVDTNQAQKHGIIPGDKIKPMFECDFCDEIFRHRNAAVKHRNSLHLNIIDAPIETGKRGYRKKITGVKQEDTGITGTNSQRLISPTPKQSKGDLHKKKNTSVKAVALFNRCHEKQMEMKESEKLTDITGYGVSAESACEPQGSEFPRCGPSDPGSVSKYRNEAHTIPGMEVRPVTIKQEVINVTDLNAHDVKFTPVQESARMRETVAYINTVQLPSRGQRVPRKTGVAKKRSQKTPTTTITQINALFREPKPPGWIYCTH